MPDATAADWAKVFERRRGARVRAGLAVVQAGEQDRALYLLTDGTLGVRLPRAESVFKAIDAPAVVGEVAFFDGLPRSATLEAVTDVEVVRLAPEGLDRLAGGARARPRDAARPRARPGAAAADRQRGDRELRG